MTALSSIPLRGVVLPPGPACLTFSWQDLKLGQQENVVLLGESEASDASLRVRVEPALSDWSITGNRLTRTLRFMANGRQLRPRLTAESARRGQPAPVVRVPPG